MHSMLMDDGDLFAPAWRGARAVTQAAAVPFHTAFVWQQLAASVQVRPAGEYKLERSIRLRGELVYTTFIDAACANEDHIAWAREQLDRCWNEVGISVLDWAD